ncbi:MAG: hypothetical protein AB7K52_11560 [Phycisphaerales bacterium]
MTIASACVLAAAGLTAIALADEQAQSKQCSGYCSGSSATCGYPEMVCCCNTDTATTPIWTCVCRKATDCNTANSCQDP